MANTGAMPNVILPKTSDTPIGLMYISEQSSPTENIVSGLTYEDKMGVRFAKFNTILQTFDVLNRNGRRYYGPNIQDMLKSERIQTLLKTNGWFGEMDHPTAQYDNQPLSPDRIKQIEMSRRSHKILMPEVRGEALHAVIQTSQEQHGIAFCNEILAGLIPSFSCRALAGIQQLNGKPYVIVRMLITYDWVLYPSHHDANMTGQPKFMLKSASISALESAGYSTSSSNQKWMDDVREKYTEDVAIPLEDIMRSIGKDANVGAIMESFDLSLNDMVGLSKDLSSVIIKDHDNMIYANISPATKNKVADYLRSF